MNFFLLLVVMNGPVGSFLLSCNQTFRDYIFHDIRRLANFLFLFCFLQAISPFPLHPQSSHRAVPALPALATAAWEAAAVVGGPTLLPLHPHSSHHHCLLLLPLQPITIKRPVGSLSIMPAPNSSTSCCFHPIPTLPGIQTQPPTCWRLLMTTLRYL